MPNRQQLKSLQPNVGFMLKQTNGYSRSIEPYVESGELEAGVAIHNLQGELDLTRTSQGIWVDGALTGSTPVECSRCLTPFSLDLTIELQELFYFPPSNVPSPTDYFIPEDGLLDLVEPVREQVILNIPISPLCRPDCQGICSHCGQDLNQGTCDCAEDEIDPRLAALKDLLSGD